MFDDVLTKWQQMGKLPDKYEYEGDEQILRLAMNGNIDDVIDELTNVRDYYYFVNVDDIINSEKFTDNIDNLKKAIEFFGKYYRACNGVYGTFDYQCIERKFLDNLKDLANELANVDCVLDKMEREYE